ncbi:hypothetical protein VPHD239_0095 [Vibrio phage D239]
MHERLIRVRFPIYRNRGCLNCASANSLPDPCGVVTC